MVSAFTGVLHVPNLSKPEHLFSVLEDSDVFSKQDLANIQRQIKGSKYVSHFNCVFSVFIYSFHYFNLILFFRIFIGIKKLLGLIDMARQTEEQYRVVKFLTKLEEEGGLDAGTCIK